MWIVFAYVPDAQSTPSTFSLKWKTPPFPLELDLLPLEGVYCVSPGSIAVAFSRSGTLMPSIPSRRGECEQAGCGQ